MRACVVPVFVVCIAFGCRGEDVGVSDGAVATDSGALDSLVSDAVVLDSLSADALASDALTDAVSSEVCGVHPGPRMVPLKTSKGTYCVDTTEVTNAQYALFSETATKPPLPTYCAWKTSYAVENPLAAAKQLPVVNVDWCDAYQYCAWSGKRLCGGLAGGHVIRTGTTLAGFLADSQWTLACQNNVPTKYSTGDTFPGGPSGVCNITRNAGALWSTTSGSACKGASPGFDEIVDLTGNAGEWEDNCSNYDAASASTVVCLVRGSRAAPGPVNEFEYECLYADIVTRRNEPSARTGFRCCSK